jgi:perosamine synthetase
VIPYARQSISDNDIQVVSDVLRSDWLTTGPKLNEFEDRFGAYVGAKHAIAVCNGTAALHLAMLVAEIGPGDRVVTSPNTFLASANCAAFVGATPDFSDIDPVSYNLCPRTLRQNWRNDTRAVVAVDYAGQACDMPSIAEIARQNGAIIIEDACHAVGGRFEYGGKVWKIGGHPWADMTTFSFHPAKTMTTGEGGMLVTDNDDYAKKARILRNHGMVRDAAEFEGLGGDRLDEQGPWYYEMQFLGYNFRITDVQCAMGLSQLTQLDEFVSDRRKIVDAYNKGLSRHSLITLPQLRNPHDQLLTSWHLYSIQLDFTAIGATRSECMKTLQESGIGTQVLYIPVHLQPWYRRKFGYSKGKCPIAEQYYEHVLSLPLYPTLCSADVKRIIAATAGLLTLTQGG